MPLYEYRCSSCSSKFEKYVRAWGDPVVCPGCGGDVEKLISRFAMTSGAPDSGGPSQAAAEIGGGGSCCGGGCGCAN